MDISFLSFNLEIMKHLTVYITGILFFIIIFIADFGCSNPNSAPQNTKPIDSMFADISGDKIFTFKTNTVNAEVFPNDSGQIIQMSGTVVKGPFEIYTIYFAFLNDGSGKTEFSLDSTGGFSRFEYTLGATTEKIIYGYNLTGNLSITQNTATNVAGTFNIKAKLFTDTTKYIEIKNGIFYYTTEN